MTDGERRCSCNVHVYLFSEPRKKTAIRMLRTILGPAFVWERSANVPAPSLTKASHGCGGSLSSTNVQHVRATVRFSSHFTEVCEADSHVSRRCASHSPQKPSNIRAIYQETKDLPLQKPSMRAM